MSSFARGVSLPCVNPAARLHLADDGVKRAIAVLRRAEVAQASVWLSSEAFQQRSGEPRFADTRFTGKQHYLSFAVLCLRPTPQQQFEFFFAPDEFQSVRPRVGCLETATKPMRVAMPPGLAGDLTHP